MPRLTGLILFTTLILIPQSTALAKTNGFYPIARGIAIFSLGILIAGTVVLILAVVASIYGIIKFIKWLRSRTVRHD